MYETFQISQQTAFNYPALINISHIKTTVFEFKTKPETGFKFCFITNYYIRKQRLFKLEICKCLAATNCNFDDYIHQSILLQFRTP